MIATTNSDIDISSLTQENKLQLVGSRLLDRGFETWFKFFFKYIERVNFIVDPIHLTLFDTFNKIEYMDPTYWRTILNIPPRSAKTTCSQYFIIYAITKYPHSQFIYTTYSSSLASDTYYKIKQIMNSPVYRTMYESRFLTKSTEIDEEIDKSYDIDSLDHTLLHMNKITGTYYFTNGLITTSMNGSIYCASIGSQITGKGFGVRNSNKKLFSGCMFIDDPDKAQDGSVSLKRLENTHRYYSGTLLTRANNSYAPIIIDQQRIHHKDLSGYVSETYENINVIKIPLINPDGTCNIPSQYTEKRISELQLNKDDWLAQYQQNPVEVGGNVIDVSWFKEYRYLPQLSQYYIVGDTAFKTGTSNDYSVFQLWGRDNSIQDSNYYLIDSIRGKWESPDLLKTLLNFYIKWKSRIKISCLYIEDKASGIGLIQQIRRMSIPVKPVQKNKDKYTCLMDVLPRIASGYVFIPYSSSWKIDFINECRDFRKDMTHDHDDQVDCLSMALSQNAIGYTLRDIL